MEKSYFMSADGKTEVAYFIFEDKKIKPRAVLQISHGMNEFILRYKDFASMLTKHGIVVVGNDDLGHGETKTPETEGFFADKHGDKFVLEDLHTMAQIAKLKYPQLPFFMFGHSMGSFFARLYASVYPNDHDGFIFCGTSGKVKGSAFAMILLKLIKLFKGPNRHYHFIDKIMVSSYFKYIKNPQSALDWLSSDPNNLNREGMGKNFSVGAYHDMVKTLRKVNTKSWAKKLNKQTPILLIAGSQDPVGQYGSGVCNVYKLLEKEKIESIDLKLYAKCRHEPFSETDFIKKQFYQDLLTWIDEKIAKINKK